MKKYDLIIIGGGGGLKLRPASELGLKIAVIEKDALGGTCLNRGCIPSKMLIHAADVAEQIREAHKFDINVDTNFSVNFKKLVTRVTETVTKDSKSIESSYKENPNIDFYHAEAKFLENRVIEVKGEKLTADKIFIATGSRPLIPNIEGLQGTPFWTNTEALRNTKAPKKLIVIGGGYIAVELGHFYAALGIETQFIVRSQLIRFEDAEIIAEFSRVFREKYQVETNCTAKNVTYKNHQFTVSCESGNGKLFETTGDALLIATGVIPNTDNLGLENTSIEIDQKGFIKVNDQLQTTAENVYALGDCIGRYLFRHSVNFEGEYLLRTLYPHPSTEPIKYSPMPHAIFSSPQVAGVGATEDELHEQGVKYFKGLNKYENSAMGDALLSDHGFVKLLFDLESKKLLAAHIVGPEASNMIHMLIAYMNMNATLDDLLRTIYIHPALPENIRNAARKAKEAYEYLQQKA